MRHRQVSGIAREIRNRRLPLPEDRGMVDIVPLRERRPPADLALQAALEEAAEDKPTPAQVEMYFRKRVGQP